MSQTLPFDWSRRTRVDWTTSESLSDIQGLFFLRATEDGKSALIYSPLMMEPGIVAIIASPIDLLESDQVRNMEGKGVIAVEINQSTLRAAAPAAPS
ncbi:hypothetical protein BS47DRAFT_1341914 [Hydnum rufescens UP504]|uniref:Uncharacterized protein n=1 Tax=Hydnum rufescens UP504 TaxID=1448309 RepID=A0A9P6B3C0_9AGAM|nr:hypothetical protein BS47DRAFT_1341914 [Hydnum rufescens UP504]